MTPATAGGLDDYVIPTTTTTPPKRWANNTQKKFPTFPVCTSFLSYTYQALFQLWNTTSWYAFFVSMYSHYSVSRYYYSYILYLCVC